MRRAEQHGAAEAKHCSNGQGLDGIEMRPLGYFGLVGQVNSKGVAMYEYVAGLCFSA